MSGTRVLAPRIFQCDGVDLGTCRFATPSLFLIWCIKNDPSMPSQRAPIVLGLLIALLPGPPFPPNGICKRQRGSKHH